MLVTEIPRAGLGYDYGDKLTGMPNVAAAYKIQEFQRR